MLEELWGGGMALGGPRARPASRRLSRVAAGVGGKVSCWRRLAISSAVLAATHLTVLVFCCVCLLCGCVDRFQGCGRRKWAVGGGRSGCGGVRLG